MQNPFLENRGHYLALAERHCDRYARASPFPHAVLDDFLPEALGRRLLDEFPDASDPSWRRFNDPTGLKLASQGASELHELTREVLASFNSAPFLEFLQRLTGIEGLISDPWFEGGGLHQIPRGGFLKIHADFNRHERLQLDRRINVLWYLNPDWKEEYGGHLELWNREMTGCEQRILPVFNRCVVFNTTDTAYHGHPEPLSCPEGWTRKSVALYYYTNGRPAEETSADHSTLYQLRPEERRRQESLGYRFRNTCSDGLEAMASIAHKPAGLLRRLSEAMRPPY